MTAHVHTHWFLNELYQAIEKPLGNRAFGKLVSHVEPSNAQSLHLSTGAAKAQISQIHTSRGSYELLGTIAMRKASLMKFSKSQQMCPALIQLLVSWNNTQVMN